MMDPVRNRMTIRRSGKIILQKRDTRPESKHSQLGVLMFKTESGKMLPE